MVLKLTVLLFLYLFLFATISLIYRDLVVATAGERKPEIKIKKEPVCLPPPRLVILESPGKNKGDFFELRQSLIIGREQSCDIILEDKAASNRHARLFKLDDKYLLEDLGSSNGTFVHDEPVDRPMPVKPGDRIQIGQTILEIVG